MAQRVLIVGATSAIAAEVARTYAGRGARLHLLARSPDKLGVLLGTLAPAVEGGAPLVTSELADFNELTQVEGLVERAVKALGGVDVVLIAHGDLGDQLESERAFAAADAAFRANFLSVVAFLVPLANAMEAERRRDAELAVSAAALENFKQQIAESTNSLALLEGDAMRAFAGFGTFKRMLSGNRQGPPPNPTADENQLYEELLQAQHRANEEVPKFKSSLLRNLVVFTPPAWLLIIAAVALAILEFTDVAFAH